MQKKKASYTNTEKGKGEKIILSSSLKMPKFHFLKNSKLTEKCRKIKNLSLRISEVKPWHENYYSLQNEICVIETYSNHRMFRQCCIFFKYVLNTKMV